jgi:hypothetical protein
LEINRIETYLAEAYPQPGTSLSGKISNAIDQSNCVIAVFTRDGVRSQWVNQEIGYAKKAAKIVIPIVEEGVPHNGFVQGIEYVPFSRENPTDAISRIIERLAQLKANKETQEKIIAGFLILLGLLALAASNKE